MSIDLHDHNVIAAFRDLEAAEEAHEVLVREGFADDQLSILGQPVEQVDLDDDELTTAEEMGESVGKGVVTGGAAGSAVGAVATALGAAAVASIPGVGLLAGTGALAGAISGAGAGATVGAIVGGEAAMRSNHRWQQVLAAIKHGGIVLGVHSGDAEPVDRAQELLEELEPMDLARVDGRGRSIDRELPV